MRYHELQPRRLDEIGVTDRFSFGDALKRHPNDYIHFSKIHKVGINPAIGIPQSKRGELADQVGVDHHNPHGVYFYPNGWLAGQYTLRSQYAVEYPYYFVCAIDFDGNGFDLGEEHDEDAFWHQANKAGWGDEYNAALNFAHEEYDGPEEEDEEDDESDPEVEVEGEDDSKEDNSGWSDVLPRDWLDKLNALFDRFDIDDRYGGFDAGILWFALAHYLVNVDGRYTWPQLMKGVSYLRDKGYGIIHHHEPHQVIVFDTRLIKILESGDNKERLSKPIDAIFQALTPQVSNAAMRYRQGLAEITFTLDGANFFLVQTTKEHMSFHLYFVDAKGEEHWFPIDAVDSRMAMQVDTATTMAAKIIEVAAWAAKRGVHAEATVSYPWTDGVLAATYYYTFYVWPKSGEPRGNETPWGTRWYPSRPGPKFQSGNMVTSYPFPNNDGKLRFSVDLKTKLLTVTITRKGHPTETLTFPPKAKGYSSNLGSMVSWEIKRVLREAEPD